MWNLISDFCCPGAIYEDKPLIINKYCGSNQVTLKHKNKLIYDSETDSMSLKQYLDFVFKVVLILHDEGIFFKINEKENK